MISKRLFSILICGLSAATWPGAQQIGYHEPRVDAAGRIVPWYGTGPSQAYNHVVRIVFDFWLNMRNCANGVPYYLQHQVWAPGADDPRGLGGDQIPMALSSWTLLHGYLGNPAAKQNMILMADYWLAHGHFQAGPALGQPAVSVPTRNSTPDVRGGKMDWNPVTKVLRVRATAKTVTVLAGK